MKNYFALFLCLTALYFTACEKANETENKPSTTEQITGTNGQTILGGSGAPKTELGNNGDFYLDKTTANLYGPKTENAWPQPFNLANNTGTTGTPGTKILNGTVAPALSIGAIGDFYFDTAGLNFYGPKTAGSWGLPISLKVQTDGAKVLILKNQVFNSVVRDTAGYSKMKLQLIELNKQYENLKLKWLSGYFYKPNNVAFILPIRATTDQQKAFLTTLRASLPGNISPQLISDSEVFSLPDEFFNIEKQIIGLEINLGVGNFILNTEISIDAKYQNYYDNGMVVVYLSNPLAKPLFWDNESITLFETKDIMNGYTYTATSASCSVDKISKDKVYLRGRSYRVDEALVKALKFDVKIVFIPASDVKIMSAAKVDTHNLKAVSRYLGVVLNK